MERKKKHRVLWEFCFLEKVCNTFKTVLMYYSSVFFLSFKIISNLGDLSECQEDELRSVFFQGTIKEFRTLPKAPSCQYEFFHGVYRALSQGTALP